MVSCCKYSNIVSLSILSKQHFHPVLINITFFPSAGLPAWYLPPAMILSSGTRSAAAALSEGVVHRDSPTLPLYWRSPQQHMAVFDDLGLVTPREQQGQQHPQQQPQQQQYQRQRERQHEQLVLEDPARISGRTLTEVREAFSELEAGMGRGCSLFDVDDDITIKVRFLQEEPAVPT